MFILLSTLIAMGSIYIGQLVWPAAAPLVMFVMCMGSYKRGVATGRIFPYPALPSVSQTVA